MKNLNIGFVIGIMYILRLRSELLHRSHLAEFDIFDPEMRQKISSIKHHKFVRQEHKLRNLINREENLELSIHKFFDRFKNLAFTNFFIKSLET